MSKIINKLFILIIRLYQFIISPLFPSSCRYYPTCSSYAVESFEKHRWYHALWLSIKRVGRCHPWHEGGYDPVPPSEKTGIKHG